MNKIIKALQLLKSPKYIGGAIRGVIATMEHEKALKPFRFATVVDIGANKGQFSLLARTLFPGVKIYAFEPLQVPAAKYSKMFDQERARLYQVAIGPCDGQAEMNVAGRDDSSSLLPITDLHAEIFPGTEKVRQETVTVGPLDRFMGQEDIKGPALLKIDVQGYELEALEGCAGFLPLFDNVYVECSFIEFYEGQALIKEVIDYLYDNKFELYGIYDLKCDKDHRAAEADLMFQRRQA